MSSQVRGAEMATLDEIAAGFRFQAQWCGKLGSPLYARLLERAADDIDARGPIAGVVEGWSGNVLTDAMPLRFMGAIHRRVLAGEEPALAAHYPSAGGAPRWPQVWDAFVATVVDRAPQLRADLSRGVQTNEVNRSAVLLGGFLRIAAATRLPLRIREIGASAGLNLLWDRYRYQLSGGGAWGDPSSSVCIRGSWDGNGEVLKSAATVSSRSGCDLAPVEVADEAQVRAIESFIWPDQLKRLEVFRAATELARRQPPPLVRASAAAWLERELATLPEGEATVVFHSIMWWYMPEAERDAVSQCIEAAGDRAHAGAPLAWLQLETRRAEGADLRLRLWPGVGERVLAEADPHGTSVRWLEA